MKTSLRALLTSLVIVGSSNASALSLPAGPCDGQTNCIQFTDFSVYSLPFLTYSTGQDYVAASAPGQISSNIILGINNGNSNNPAYVDGAYNTPSPNNNQSATFTTYGSDPTTPTGGGNPNNPPPAGTGQTWGAGDGNGWDASVDALKTKLGSSDLVAFFAFNETGQNNLNGGAMLIWVHAQLRNFETNQVMDFYLQPTGSTKTDDPNFVSAGGSQAPWTLVHAGVCVANKTFVAFPTLGANGAETCPTGTTLITQSTTGQNDAAFAVYSDKLNDQVKNGDWDVLHIDWKMDFLNGGGETAWIAPFDVDDQRVPEPGTLSLLGLALLGISARKMLKKR